jgi:hypothetical protein
MRWACLRKGLQTMLHNTAYIVVATAVLHNLAIEWGDPLPEDVGQALANEVIKY